MKNYNIVCIFSICQSIVLLDSSSWVEPSVFKQALQNFIRPPFRIDQNFIRPSPGLIQVEMFQWENFSGSAYCDYFIFFLKTIFIGMFSLRYLSRLMGKLTICIGEKKDADQLRGNREADQRLCFRY